MWTQSGESDRVDVENLGAEVRLYFNQVVERRGDVLRHRQLGVQRSQELVDEGTKTTG